MRGGGGDEGQKVGMMVSSSKGGKVKSLLTIHTWEIANQPPNKGDHLTEWLVTTDAGNRGIWWHCGQPTHAAY